jgi:hypothetical protein
MLITAILFVFFGILIKYGKMYFLIAGYNTTSKEEKGKYDIEGIANIFRNVMFGMAFIIILGALIGDLTKNENLVNYSFCIAMAARIPYLLLKSNSKKYKK